MIRGPISLMTQTEKDFIRRLSSMGLSLTEDQLAGFRTYYENLTEWNRVMNLTAITEEEDVYTKHFLDCLSLVRIVSRETLRGKRMIDVGTGAGFPGLVLAIAFPDMEVVLMDSLNKRIRFLDDTAEKLGLSNVRTIHARAEELARDKRHRETYDMCCSRAVASAAVLSEYCLPFIRKGGLFAAYKSEKAEQELEEGKRAIQILGGRVERTESFVLPETDYGRTLVLIRKVKETPGRYPRKAGTPAKDPIR